MKNKLIISLFISLVTLSVLSKPAFTQIDSEAVTILDSMSCVVSGLGSCSFTLNTEYDTYSGLLGLIRNSDEASVFLKAPDKFYVKRDGDKGNKSFYYDNNQYASVPAPSTIMETIDSIHNEYGIDFPAADIFYPDIVDDIVANSDALSYLGMTMVEGKICHHIAGVNKELTFQVWIANDETYLPVKMAIVYTSKAGNPQYQAIFRNWSLNPELQDSMFDFVIPAGASKIKFLKKN
jgi:hypothetical protein